jgi:hypothetical protein
MREQTRSRAYREGWGGRRRNYKCRIPGCGNKFQHDGNQLPPKARICYECRNNLVHAAAYRAAFHDEVATGVV